MEIIYKPILKRAKGPISLDDVDSKGAGKRTFQVENSHPKLYERKSLQNLFEDSQNIREDEKFRGTKQLLDYKYKETPEYSVEKVINRKKLVTSLDERRNNMPIIAPGDKLYRNVDYSSDFFKEGGLVTGSTNSARYNKTVGKKANNFYDTMDLSSSNLDPKKLWKNKQYEEEQDFNKKYVSGLKSWEVNYLGLLKVSKEIKEDKKNMNKNKKGLKESPKKKK